ncbi:MAG: hypothetical protein OIF50_16135 [Flavobacteriaceae bacterium]|nr:hypothetical protein [Flavobacteriaceae bacterium]
MKKIVSIFLLAILASCNQQPKSSATAAPTKAEVSEESTDVSGMPAEMQKVIAAHGGANNWKRQRTMVFHTPKGDSVQKHTLNLKSRQERIEDPKFTMGNDGKKLWVVKKDAEVRDGIRFYNNLLFYFYAMPQVLLDKGIYFEAIEPLQLGGGSFPGFRIRFAAGRGDSDKDVYLLYYDPETYRVQWLAYTVTFFSKETSQKYNWIRYGNYMVANGVVLPKEISWVKVVDGKPTSEVSNTVVFDLKRLDDQALDGAIFAMPADAEIVP